MSRKQRGADAMERLDLPLELSSNIARMELAGNRSFYMDGHRGVLSYSTTDVDVSGGSVVVRLHGENLQLLVMTENELRITGTIRSIELVE